MPIGKSALRNHKAGKTISPKNAILAKCNECCNDYQDGTEDCDIPECPLYPWMPYKKKGTIVKRKMTAKRRASLDLNKPWEKATQARHPKK